jgi:DNA modification methylase
MPRKKKQVPAVSADKILDFTKSQTREDWEEICSKSLNGWVRLVPIDQLYPYSKHTRKILKQSIKKLAKGIDEFGFLVPVLAKPGGTVISGHIRILAAKIAGLTHVPVIYIDHLTDAQITAFRIFDNRIVEEGEWDKDALAAEFQVLIDMNFDVNLTGFETGRVDFIIGEQRDSANINDDTIPPVDEKAFIVTQIGDTYVLDQHSLICATARHPQSYVRLMGNEMAQMVITDMPYNVKIKGNVGGGGSVKHSEFVEASGELSYQGFNEFLDDVISNLISHSVDGSVHDLFIDWRHLHQLQSICNAHYSRQLNLCIWAKTNGGMGSLYRSQHELVVVYKNGAEPHINNVQLGTYGRNRTNVWTYEGANSINPERREELKLHPTVKPTKLIEDAILDCSEHNGIILDPFCGSGTILIACENTGRVARTMELDPRYVDVAIRRWQDYTGGTAIHAQTGRTFDELSEIRDSEGRGVGV